MKFQLLGMPAFRQQIISGKFCGAWLSEQIVTAIWQELLVSITYIVVVCLLYFIKATATNVAHQRLMKRMHEAIVFFFRLERRIFLERCHVLLLIKENRRKYLLRNWIQSDQTLTTNTQILRWWHAGWSFFLVSTNYGRCPSALCPSICPTNDVKRTTYTNTKVYTLHTHRDQINE